MGIGLVTSAAGPQLARIAGYHWLAIDMEHHPLTLADVAQICQIASAVGVTPVVRVRAEALHEAARALDNGAQGILVPGVGSRADAERMVAMLRFAPVGARSWGGAAAAFAYAPPPLHEALSQANAETLLAAMIETEAGLENVDEIAATPGVDVLFVGAVDLSIALGVAGDLQSAAMAAAFERIAAAARRHRKAFGVGGVYDNTLAPRLIGLGARFLAAGGDQALLLSAATARATLLASHAPH